MSWSKSISHRIVTAISLVVVPLAVGLVCIMASLLYSHTDKTMLDLLEPMAKTVAKGVEERLHLLVDRLYLIKDNSTSLHSAFPRAEIEKNLNQASNGIEFLWIGLYDKDGAFVVGSESSPRNISSRQKFSLMLRTGNLVIEDTSIGESGLEIVMGIPVQFSGISSPHVISFDTTYYLVGCYSYDILADVLSSVSLKATNAVFIINENGYFVAHKDLGEVFGNNSVEGHLGQEITRKMTAGQTGADSIVTKDGLSFVGFAPVLGTKWSLGVEMLRSDFTKTAEQGVLLSAIGTIALLFLFACALYLFFRESLSAPLRAITESARKLSVGELETNLPKDILQRQDEIGQLSTTFVSMTRSITRVIHDLDTLTNAARAGYLSCRVSRDGYSGYYDSIISGMNSALDVFRMYLDSLPNAMMLLDGNEQCIHANNPMLELVTRMGFTDNEKEFLHLLFASGDKHSADQVAGYFAGYGDDEVLNINITLTERGGQDVYYVLNIHRIEINNPATGYREQSGCFMLMLSNVTQLGKAIMAAEAASKAKGDFLSCMSHEMRTPMNAILGMASIAKRSPSAERKEYCLDKITEASQHLLGIINDILDMSKIEAQKFELSQTVFSFEKMLQQAVNVVSFTAEKKEQSFVVEVDPNLPQYIVSDEQRLAQVIANLLGNAVKFTPNKGSVSLKANVAKITDDCCIIRFEVRDNGIGISVEQQKNLFASFGQADSSISRRFGGTGLGLAISKKIIELMGGQIRVTSEANKGATFVFEVKVVPSRQMDALPRLPGQLSDKPDYSVLRVLVVDSSREVLESIKKKLYTAGVLHCSATTEASEALALVQKHENLAYSLAIIDAKLANDASLPLAREISRISLGKTVLVMATGMATPDAEQTPEDAIVENILHKPVFMSQLLEKLNACLEPNEDALTQATSGLESSAKQKMLDLANHRILIAEDIDINCEIIGALLEPTNASITFVQNGREAIEAFSREPDAFSLILMDLQMPEVDGHTATKTIRASGLPRATTIPIVAMTANVFQDDIDRSLAAGMNAHLGKPINLKELFATLKKFVL